MYDGAILKPDLDDVFNDSCFAHYGVKGMHWGVRKAIDRVSGAIRQRKNAKTMSNVGKLMNSKAARYYSKSDWFGNKFSYRAHKKGMKRGYGAALRNPNLSNHDVFKKISKTFDRDITFDKFKTKIKRPLRKYRYKISGMIEECKTFGVRRVARARANNAIAKEIRYKQFATPPGKILTPFGSPHIGYDFRRR